jgi:hypothetical protein
MSHSTANEIPQPSAIVEISDEELKTVTGGVRGKPKIRDLIQDLKDAGFTQDRNAKGGGGNHSFWIHPDSGTKLSLSGGDKLRKDAQLYQMKDVKNAIEKAANFNPGSSSSTGSSSSSKKS